MLVTAVVTVPPFSLRVMAWGLLGGSIISHRTQASPEAGMLGEPVYLLTLTGTVLSSEMPQGTRDSGPASRRSPSSGEADGEQRNMHHVAEVALGGQARKI